VAGHIYVSGTACQYCSLQTSHRDTHAALPISVTATAAVAAWCIPGMLTEVWCCYRCTKSLTAVHSPLWLWTKLGWLTPCGLFNSL
jgi:hypothetical protein